MRARGRQREREREKISQSAEVVFTILSKPAEITHILDAKKERNGKTSTALP